MLSNAAILADADRRATSRRHILAEAERDAARRRRLTERVRPLVAAERPFIDLMAECAPSPVKVRDFVQLGD